jgi:hypothetical protein
MREALLFLGLVGIRVIGFVLGAAATINGTADPSIHAA